MKSDKCCEQFGYRASGTTQTITLLKEYTDTNYVVIIGDHNIGIASTNSRFCKTTAKTTSSFTTNGCYQNGSGTDYGYHWHTIGYIS